MTRTSKKALALAILFGTILALLWLAPSGIKPAPSARVVDMSGQQTNMADYFGRPLVVTFWATNCPSCIQEIPHLVELHERFAPQGLAVMAVAMAYDGLEQVRELARERQLPYLVVWDFEGEAASAFGNVRVTPTTFLVSPTGRIVKQTLGPFDVAEYGKTILSMLDKG